MGKPPNTHTHTGPKTTPSKCNNIYGSNNNNKKNNTLWVQKITKPKISNQICGCPQQRGQQKASASATSKASGGRVYRSNRYPVGQKRDDK